MSVVLSTTAGSTAEPLSTQRTVPSAAVQTMQVGGTSNGIPSRGNVASAMASQTIQFRGAATTANGPSGTHLSTKAPVGLSKFLPAGIVDAGVCHCGQRPPQCDFVCDENHDGDHDVVDIFRAARGTPWDEVVTEPTPRKLESPPENPMVPKRLSTGDAYEIVLAPKSAGDVKPQDNKEATARNPFGATDAVPRTLAGSSNEAAGHGVAEGSSAHAFRVGDDDAPRMVLDLEDGRHYEGAAHNGEPHGRGQMVYSNGDVYCGEWKNGLRHGQGEFRQPGSGGDSATTYRGQWVEGLKDGSGIEEWADGTRYEGEFRRGEAHGCGALTFPSGIVRRVVHGDVAT